MAAILELLAERSALSLFEVIDHLGVSAATARRDLADLDSQGLLTRTHGGARAVAEAAEVPVRLRAGRLPDVKERIARRAASLLPTGPYAVAIGGGTTAAAVAHALIYRPDLTIVTNSLSTANEISMRPNLRVIMTGGVVRSHSYELVGSLSEYAFSAMNIGTAFLGIDGISRAGGITTHDVIEARTNAAMIHNAQRTVIVADSSKIGRITLAKVAELGDDGKARGVDDLVTDDGADPLELEEIRDAGVEVHLVARAS